MSFVHIDGPRTGCVCGPACEHPCFLRVGMTSDPCCKACAPLPAVAEDCPDCDGAGEITFNPSPVKDPQCEDSARCGRCHGHGVFIA